MAVEHPFFEHPILNSPYEEPRKHWELDKDGQPTQQIVFTRRSAEFISPIPKPRKRKGQGTQTALELRNDDAISTQQQQYASAIINDLRAEVDATHAVRLGGPDVKRETASTSSGWAGEDEMVPQLKTTWLRWMSPWPSDPTPYGTRTDWALMNIRLRGTFPGDHPLVYAPPRPISHQRFPRVLAESGGIRVHMYGLIDVHPLNCLHHSGRGQDVSSQQVCQMWFVRVQGRSDM